ncbi:hypothetical protein GCM10009760_40850 [Kitasatospora kazusensis]|uniref:MYXO-CTERM domain-containing protein n=1 Tax=Kitasatospora kazusensis TaxID=407974 RepID=A0ABN2ZW65_9ACTN
MRSTRTAAAALLGAAALLVLAAPANAAPAKDAEPAWVNPSEAGPGESVTVSVTCGSSSAKTVTASSQAFSTGSATLTAGPDGRYSGSVRLASKEEFSTKVPAPAGKGPGWGLDGSCPNGDTFTGAVSVLLTEKGDGAKGGDWKGRPDEAAPHGAVKTGLGGSVGGGSGELATGGALVAAGVGGFWLLRRRCS